jgi:hypothetical protein
MGQHKVTVSVEINGQSDFSLYKEFSSGNPIYHAEEFVRAVSEPVTKIEKALKAVYGDRTAQAEPTPVKARNIEQAVEEAQERGAAVYRYVLKVNGMEFIGEALYRVKFLNEWESMINRPELSEVQFGIRTADKFVYNWVTL